MLEVIYLVFNEGYAATAGDDWMRPALCEDALRLGRILAELAPRGAGGPRPGRADGDPGVALARAARARGRAGPAARPGSRAVGPAPDPSRAGGAGARRAARRRARSVRAAGRDRGVPRARARAATTPDWPRIAALYDELARVTPSPVVELNRAVALGMAFGPAAGLELVGRADVRAVARALPPAAERARRPAGEAGPPRRGARRIRARRGADAQRRAVRTLLPERAAALRAEIARLRRAIRFDAAGPPRRDLVMGVDYLKEDSHEHTADSFSPGMGRRARGDAR